MRTIIENGLVVDPSNKICSKLDVAVEEGKIKELAARKLVGDKVIDAQGLVVSPGFVDIHMHEDAYNAVEERFEIDILACMLKMGVTTAIGGNCGIGPEKPDLYMNAAERLGLPVNLGLLLPHETLRRAVNISDRYGRSSLDEIREMVRLAEYYLDCGCLGMSYGIRYIPGLSAPEMLELNKVVSRRHKLVAAHVRNDASEALQALSEFLQSGPDAEVSFQVSHIGSIAAYGQMEDFLALLDEFCSIGIDVAADCYPYAAFSTRIGTTTFDEGFINRYGGDYGQIEAAEGEFKGQRLNEDLYRYLRQKAPETLMIAHVMKDDEVSLAFSHPKVLMGSDGLLHHSQGHPRAAGAFPRFIKNYVREKKLLGLCEAVSKITCQPARRIGIDKGTLGIGKNADITIFDYERIADKATFTDPVLSPEGIAYVILEGEIAVKDGCVLQNNLGKMVRSKH